MPRVAIRLTTKPRRANIRELSDLSPAAPRPIPNRLTWSAQVVFSVPPYYVGAMKHPANRRGSFSGVASICCGIPAAVGFYSFVMSPVGGTPVPFNGNAIVESTSLLRLIRMLRRRRAIKCISTGHRSLPSVTSVRIDGISDCQRRRILTYSAEGSSSCEMENYHSAFLPGEYAILRSRSELEQIQTDWAANIISSDMAAHANEQVLITGRSYFHCGYVLYNLDGLPGYWPEAAIRDQQLGENDEPENQPACATYVAVKSDDGKFVDIRHHDGRLFCSFRRIDPDSAVADINRVANLRTRLSFALRYEFDGVESAEPDDDWHSTES